MEKPGTATLRSLAPENSKGRKNPKLPFPCQELGAAPGADINQFSLPYSRQNSSCWVVWIWIPPPSPYFSSRGAWNEKQSPMCHEGASRHCCQAKGKSWQQPPLDPWPRREHNPRFFCKAGRSPSQINPGFMHPSSHFL